MKEGRKTSADLPEHKFRAETKTLKRQLSSPSILSPLLRPKRVTKPRKKSTGIVVEKSYYDATHTKSYGRNRPLTRCSGAPTRTVES